MNENTFEQYCDLWRTAAIELAEAHDNFRNVKHRLELAKANAWADGQVTGSNSDHRKAALYIITEPFVEKLINAEASVMKLQIEERYLRSRIEYAIWKDVYKPDAFLGIRELIDVHNPS
jgi:hypothetical protein